MTEKRFVHKNESIIDTQTGELVNASSEDGAEILVMWLNELSDKYAEQRKENYGLLDGIAFYEEENASLSERISDLECENEQLKSVIKEVTELLSDEVDLFSDKATEHDIIAYVELKEFDNKDAYYMATATKKAIQMLKELVE